MSKPLIKVYCDESRQNDSHKLIGGVWIKKDQGWPFVNDYHAMCIQTTGSIPRHVKWQRVPSKTHHHYMKWYTSLIDLYFKYNKAGHMYFRTVVSDKVYRFDHKEHNEGDFEEGFYKLYWQLLVHVLKPNCQYEIRVAKRDTSKKTSPLDESERLEKLFGALNNGCRKLYNYSFFHNPVLSIESRPEKNRLLIQLADLLTGAVGYHWNDLHLQTTASEGPVYLADYIAQKLSLPNLKIQTPSNDRNFNVFLFRPK